MTRQEIDAAIARYAETETLFDQPYEDNKRVRVCGPFSVESLSPHRVLSTADENQDGTVSEREAHQQQDFATMILENLKKAGVQNTRKRERLIFDRLEPYPGKWLQASGEYTDGDGKTYRVAVTIGPEHGTVGPQQVKDAAKEAVMGVGFDMLIVCGFAFDPHVSEEVKRYGRLTVLPAKMNPDLAMGDELLKKTGAGNLFMVFGEPDVEIRRDGTGQVVVEIQGVDVYDPTTGQIRSASTMAAACSVTEPTVYHWAKVFGWAARADALDVEARQRVYRRLIGARTKILQWPMKADLLLMDQATDYRERHAVADEKNAITAAAHGAKLARQAVGIPENYVMDEQGALSSPPAVQVNVTLEAHEAEVANAAEEVLKAVMDAVQGGP